MIPRIRTGLGTFVPEYVKSYDSAHNVGFHLAVSAVVEIGVADSVVIFVRLSQRLTALDDPAPAGFTEVMTMTAAVVSAMAKPRRRARRSGFAATFGVGVGR